MQKTVCITGASSGFGKCTAELFLKNNWKVIALARRIEPLNELKSLALSDGQLLIHSLDVQNEKEVTAFFQSLPTSFKQIDVLFNNAGVGAPPINLEDLTLAQWKAAVDTNLTGAFLCTQHAFRIMKDQTPRGGRIINNGSISAHVPRPNSAPYTSTKHAITGLTRSTSLDGRKYDIACGQIDIGNAATPMTARMATGVAQPDGSVRAEPTMDVAHVGETIRYMAALPLDANVQFITIMATKMPFIGRG